MDEIDFTIKVNEMIRDPINDQYIRYNHKGLSIRSKLEIAWFDEITEKYPLGKLYYEPGCFIAGDNTYKPDFILTPLLGNRRQKSRGIKRRIIDLLRFGIVIEIKPDIEDLIIKNQINLVETEILLIIGHPRYSPKFYIVDTVNSVNRDLWKISQVTSLEDGINKIYDMMASRRKFNNFHRQNEFKLIKKVFRVLDKGNNV